MIGDMEIQPLISRVTAVVIVPLALAFGATEFHGTLASDTNSAKLDLVQHVEHLDLLAREPMIIEHPDGTLFVSGYGGSGHQSPQTVPRLWKSSDHGATWQTVNVGTEAEGAVANSDVDLALAPDGTIYFISMEFDRKAGEGTHIVVGVNFYELPTGIAIDREAGRVLVADTPRNLIFILDLQGTVLKRLGKNRGIGTSTVEFDHPTWIAMNKQEIAILDAGGARLQILDADYNLVRRFGVLEARAPQIPSGGGLALDGDGNIYVSDVFRSIIRIYDRKGHLQASIGQKGCRAGEFNSPTGLWIDQGNRLYVADADNDRVQLFQVLSEE
jgi:sugar lactone lactonase YvrE